MIPRTIARPNSATISKTRRTSVTDATNRYTFSTLDNLGPGHDRGHVSHSASVAQRPAGPTPRPERHGFYDDRGRTYQSTTWGVDPQQRRLGNELVSNMFYDPDSNAIESLPAGSHTFTKTTFDSLGRPVARYVGLHSAAAVRLILVRRRAHRRSSGSSSSSGENVGPLTDDVIFEQSFTTYDDAGNAIATAFYQRFHDATGLGPLNGPEGPQPAARVSYSAAWYDGIGRTYASANYGTNGNVPPIRPDSAPASSDTLLVSFMAYSPCGDSFETTDPAGMVTHTDFDNAGRAIRTIQNYHPAPACACGCAPCGCGMWHWQATSASVAAIPLSLGGRGPG